jgi:Family of unknown function (DUF5808)
MRGLRRLRRLVRLAGFGLLLAAISQEMSKPEGERTWQGKVFGIVPYDFRPPTWSRIREAYWNPADERLFTERVFGVGWAINLYRGRILLLRAFEGLMGGEAPTPVRRFAARSRSRASGE